MVFVLDRRKQPLMPCTEKRARLLLNRRRAVVHRIHPFTIRLRDRLHEDSEAQPVILKIDPGANTTGVALAREERSPDRLVHHALHLAELRHRSNHVADGMRARSTARRRRRCANLRYRAPRFHNRRHPAGWLAPSMRSRVGNLLSWARRYSRMAPVSRLEVESVRFDAQKLQDPEVSGVEYQRGELFGYEVWEYLLEKWGRRCAYCGADAMPLEKEHIVPRSRAGSDRVSNLTLSCHACNQAKGNRTAEEFGHPEVQSRARLSLRAAAAVTVTRRAIVQGLVRMGLAVRCFSGGRTKWNRARLGLAKTHALDALAVGDLDDVSGAGGPVLKITAMGRGQHSRTRTDAAGFPRGHCMRQKKVRGFQTGDLVVAVVPKGRHAGLHRGRVAVRASGSFRVGALDGISWRYCRLLQRGDGYDYSSCEPQADSAPVDHRRDGCRAEYR